MDISRRQALQVGAVLTTSGVLGLGSSARAAARGFRFVYLTDLHIQPELRAADGVAQAVRKILSLSPRPNFVITGGDHVMDVFDTTHERADLQFKLLNEALKRLEMPIYHTVGNHDVYGWGRKEGGTAKEPDYGKKMFQEKLIEGRTYRSFDFGEWHFILLDSIQSVAPNNWEAAIDDAQLEWLSTDLEQTGKQRPIVITCHVPIMTLYTQYTDKTTAAPSERGIVKNGKEIRDTFVNYNVKAVLQGHTHVVEDCLYTGTRYITGGAICGNWWKGYRLGVHPEGFGVCDVRGDKFEWQYVSYGWKAS
jgi:3',5'-cyclic AMP phosphodiesterase CpdA